MSFLIFTITAFLAGYLINMLYITVFYHRGLAHGALELKPWLRKWIFSSGPWITGIDPKAWVLMHRVHHQYSDQVKDPHSPAHQGLWGVWKGQYISYLFYLERMRLKDEPKLNLLVRDLDCEVSFLSHKIKSFLPYIIQSILIMIPGYYFDQLHFSLAFYIGIMGHPIQGWMVNALAHRYGGRNFQTNDDSRNNFLVGLFVFGEGYQNNHHARPESAKFSVKFSEIDMGYGLCVFLDKLGILKINDKKINKLS